MKVIRLGERCDMIGMRDLVRYVYRNGIITQDLYAFPSASNLEKDTCPFVKHVLL